MKVTIQLDEPDFIQAVQFRQDGVWHRLRNWQTTTICGRWSPTAGRHGSKDWRDVPDLERCIKCNRDSGE